MNKYKSNKRGLVIFIIVSFIITIFSVQLLILKPIKETKRCTEKAEATIVSVEVYRNGIRDKDNCLNSDHNHTYQYVYSFHYKGTTISGYDYRETRNNATHHKVGDVVSIRVNPNNPKEFMVELGFFDYVLMLIAIGFALFTFVLLKELFKTTIRRNL